MSNIVFYLSFSQVNEGIYKTPWNTSQVQRRVPMPFMQESKQRIQEKAEKPTVSKIPEWHVVYDEWAIHTPTGRLRHLVCKRGITEFARFKRSNRVHMVEKMTQGKKKVEVMVTYRDWWLHSRRENLMLNKNPIIHRCQGNDPYEEIQEIEVPSMVVEIAICYMKV
jgi:hypothetical protein